MLEFVMQTGGNSYVTELKELKSELYVKNIGDG